MARKKIEKKSEKWKKTLLEDRPAPGGAVSVSANTDSWASTVEKPVEPDQSFWHEILLVSEKEAARMLGVSRRKVFELSAKGDLTARKIGKRKLYSVSSLKLFAEGQVA